MTDPLDDLWQPTTPANPAAPAPRKCRRHDWYAHPAPTPCYGVDGELYLPPGTVHCRRCFKVRDDPAARRGRNNSKRGKAKSREWAKRHGLFYTEGLNKEHDGIGGENDMFVAQCKSLVTARFPGWMSRILDGLRQGNRIPYLSLIESPGPGRRERRLVVLEERDWLDLHGPQEG